MSSVDSGCERLTWRVTDLAIATGLSEAALRREIREGRLQIRRLGRAVLIPDSEARRLVLGGEATAERGAA
jgi:hypothetical protein